MTGQKGGTVVSYLWIGLAWAAALTGALFSEQPAAPVTCTARPSGLPWCDDGRHEWMAAEAEQNWPGTAHADTERNE